MTMDNPGEKTLAALSVTTAQAGSVQTAIADLEGMLSADFVARFAYGSGGTTCSVKVQTSLDGGTVWYDIARVDFTTATATTYCNNSVQGSKTMTAYADLASQGVNDGLLGSRLRAVVISTGTYANTTLDVRVNPR